MKLKKTGDWRREILGEMTVMNAEEVLAFAFLAVFFLLKVHSLQFGEDGFQERVEK